jgi:hypothetical protein
LEQIKDAIENCNIIWLVDKCGDATFVKNIESELLSCGINDERIEALYCAIMISETSTGTKTKAIFFNVASMILTNGLSFVGGSYNLAFQLLCKAIDCCPDNIEYKSSLLLTFSDIPDFDMPIAKAKEVAAQILELDPNNPVAMRYLQLH